MSEAVRGVRTLEHGDLCGRRAVTARAEAQERADIIANSVRETQDADNPLVIIDIPGRASAFALPRFVYDAIQRAAKR